MGDGLERISEENSHGITEELLGHSSAAVGQRMTKGKKVKIIVAPATIRREHLPNMSEKPYRYATRIHLYLQLVSYQTCRRP
jgi:hypothetical protein